MVRFSSATPGRSPPPRRYIITPPFTSYDVEVRATNAEGTSGWSNPGIGSTNAPGANNPPVFDEGSSAARSVSASAPADTSIGLPVAATDADSGDTLTYSLEGRDATLFDIGETNGQLLTRSGVTLIAGEPYTVTVVADDGRDRADIAVTIEATAAPPNNPPVFREGTSAARSVIRNAPAVTRVGAPFTATDADTGDTVTYSLEGTDVASFVIDPSTGQLTTLVALSGAQAGDTFTVVVVATDGKSPARLTVTITVSANTAPAFATTTASRSVSESASAGTSVGAPVTATDAERDALTYSLGGADAASFSIGGTTGQISVGPGTTLDYETRTSYTVVVTATDPSGESDAITVTINVTDVGRGTYDLDDNNRIDRSEVIAAIRDYFTGRIDRATVIELIRLYFSTG